MPFADFPGQKNGVELLQRSLGRGRLAHAYLFNGDDLLQLEGLARALAATLNCLQPVRKSSEGPAIDGCGKCLNCRKVAGDNHPDVHWVRPESKSRVIVIDQMRELMREIHLKPNEGVFKVAVIEAADRLNPQAANAFLKTLEEPPPGSVLMLLTTDPQRILETVQSRCLRLNFGGEGGRPPAPADFEWLTTFGEQAATEQKSLLSRYRLLGSLLGRLGEIKEDLEKLLTARSPLERYEDVEPRLREKWEDELVAAIEAEYRLKRADLLVLLEWWLRDVWLHASGVGGELAKYPKMDSAALVARRITAEQAMDNLRAIERTQRLLGSNVQEALALEVGLLKLKL